MALADYYQRAAQAAAQVIAGFDLDLFRKTLEQTRVGIAVSRQAAGSSEGRSLSDLVVRLLARLYPSLELRVELSDEAERLAALAQAINPHIEIAAGASIGISIGNDAPAFTSTYFAGSNGWDAFVSLQRPVKTGYSLNPFGAGVAACLAAANLFNRLFIPDWEQRIKHDLVFSTFYREKRTTSEDVPNSNWNLAGDAVLVGAGALGNAAVWAIGLSPLHGSFHVVDPEVLELSNLQRYVLAEQTDEGRVKVDLAKSHLRGPVTAVPHEQSWAEFLRDSGYDWPQVLVALDTAADRRSVQASLPKWIANAWTQPGDLGLSIHGRFDGPGACLSCLYLPTRQLPNEDEIIANALGVPELVAEIRTLLHTGTGVSRKLIQAIAAALHRPIEVVLPYEGRPVRELYVEGVCGGAVISIGSKEVARRVHVPLAHQSALAGVLLAAALVRHSLSADEQMTIITRIDLLGDLGEHLTQPALKNGNQLCICGDNDYLAAFQAKYPVARGRNT